ncbi:DUF6087 family protein [Streptomyces sp. NPDC053048]|uniref:DUF6087 family protein n=1 Tax=Streptomyces sp. NPDC053048 TaxID=3365694 RepID=UPI0037D275DF
MDDESLEHWARRREADRERKKGRLRAIPLAPGPHRGAHVHPDAPRLIVRWDGYAWQPVAVVEDLAVAKTVLYPPEPAGERPAEWDRPAPEPGAGRHRKSSRSENRDD